MVYNYKIINDRIKKYLKTNLPKKDVRPKNNKYFYLRLNRRNATLIVNSLAFTKRYLYYHNIEEIPLDLYFQKENFENDIYDLEISMLKIKEDCKVNFKNYKEYKIFKK